MYNLLSSLNIRLIQITHPAAHSVRVKARFFSCEDRNTTILTAYHEFFCLKDYQCFTQQEWVFTPTRPQSHSEDIIISTYLLSQDSLYIQEKNIVYEVDKDDLQRCINSGHLKAFTSHLFSWPVTQNSQVTPIFTRRVISRLQENIEIPPLPPTTQALLEFKNSNILSLDKLVDLIERDPLLTAQVMSWARSAFYGYRGDVSCVKEAIVRVLGVDIVLNLCLCVSLKKSFSLPDHGPLAWSVLWQRSVVTARLSQLIAQEENLAIDQNYLYLGGLLCDIGYFLLAHSFRPSYDILCREIEASPDIDPCLLEFHLFDFSHQHLGAWLLSKWNFPTEVLACVQWHHHAHVPIPHALYPQTILMARYILTSYALGDEHKSPQEMAEVLSRFGPLKKWQGLTDQWFTDQKDSPDNHHQWF